MSQRKRNVLPSPERILEEDFYQCGEPFSIADVRSRYGTTKKEVEALFDKLLAMGKLKQVKNITRAPGPAYTDKYVKTDATRELLRRAWR